MSRKRISVDAEVFRTLATNMDIAREMMPEGFSLAGSGPCLTLKRGDRIFMQINLSDDGMRAHAHIPEAMAEQEDRILARLRAVADSTLREIGSRDEDAVRGLERDLTAVEKALGVGGVPGPLSMNWFSGDKDQNEDLLRSVSDLIGDSVRVEEDRGNVTLSAVLTNGEGDVTHRLPILTVRSETLNTEWKGASVTYMTWNLPSHPLEKRLSDVITNVALRVDAGDPEIERLKSEASSRRFDPAANDLNEFIM